MLCSVFCRGKGIRETVINYNSRPQPASLRSCHFSAKCLHRQVSARHVCFHAEGWKHDRVVPAACLIRACGSALNSSGTADCAVADGLCAWVRMSPETFTPTHLATGCHFHTWALGLPSCLLLSGRTGREPQREDRNPGRLFSL